MTDDRSFERAARSWLEIGPTQAPERAIDAAFLEIASTPQERDWHVPRRLPKMTPLARALVGVAAVAVLLVGGAMFFSRQPTNGGPGVVPSPSVVPTASPRFSLDATFTSPLMGYSIKVANDWTAEPAVMAWVGTTNMEYPAADDIAVTGTDSGLTIGSQPIPAGTTFAQWIDQFHRDATPGQPDGCDGGDPSTWPTVQVGATEMGVVEHLCNAEIVFSDVGGRIYTFGLGSGTFNGDQHLKEAEFYEVLKTVVFDPTGVPEAVTLTVSFTSPLMGYTMPVDPSWTETPATTGWVGPDNSGPMVDEVKPSGTASFIHGSSQPIPDGMTFEDWLVTYHAFTTANTPTGCDGGDPSTWEPIPIGQAFGRVAVGCNTEGAVVGFKGRAYAFDLGHTNFDKDHLPSAIYRAMLRDMDLTPETAVDATPGASLAP